MDLTALLEEAVDDARIEASAAHKQLQSTLSSPAIVNGHIPTLRSALENVLRNAIRFTPEGGQIETCLEVDGRTALINIMDGGPGIADGDAENIFKPFFRSENSNGAGLGLAIARRAILIHGGVIGAANRSDGGLAIKIELPLAEAPEILQVN
jgi:signal transduction histidine kinase